MVSSTLNLGLVFLLTLSSLTRFGSAVTEVENDWQEISEDTMMLEVPETDKVRDKRQIFYPIFVAPLVRTSDSASEAGTQCLTPKGQVGVCTRLRHCYPIMHTFDLDDNGVYEGNVELARMLTDMSGSCHEGQSRGQGYSPEEVVPVTQDLICCTGNATKLNFPLISRPYIQNGVEATPGQYPSIVALMHGTFGGAKEFCGGSLVDVHNILTAAHCVQGLDGQVVAKMTVQIGDHNIYSTQDGPHETRRVSKIFYHKGYSRHTLHNDVALVRLSSPVTFSSRIKPITLASMTPPAGTSLNVAGWGRLVDGGQFPSSLRHASVPLISNEECRQKYGPNTFGGITDGMLCTFSTNSADACQGDSGGPLISASGVQVGLVSWGLGCGTYPGVYTRVAAFLPWIQKNQKQP